MNTLQDFQALSVEEQREYEKWQNRQILRRLAAQRRARRMAARQEAELNEGEQNEFNGETK